MEGRDGGRRENWCDEEGRGGGGVGTCRDVWVRV